MMKKKRGLVDLRDWQVFDILARLASQLQNSSLDLFLEHSFEIYKIGCQNAKNLPNYIYVVNRRLHFSFFKSYFVGGAGSEDGNTALKTSHLFHFLSRRHRWINNRFSDRLNYFWFWFRFRCWGFRSLYGLRFLRCSQLLDFFF